MSETDGGGAAIREGCRELERGPGPDPARQQQLVRRAVLCWCVAQASVYALLLISCCTLTQP